MTPDAFGRAIADHYHGHRERPLIQRDGERTLEHPIEQFYFDAFTGGCFYEPFLAGPLLDVGAGAGRHALYFQEQYAVTAIEVSEALCETMRARGVEDVRQADMFALCETLERDVTAECSGTLEEDEADERTPFASALAIGTQVGLARSMAGLRAFLTELALVTTPDATVVLDGYDPTHAATTELLGYRHDVADGLAARVMSFEYQDTVDDILFFRLFAPERVAAAATETGWELLEHRYPTDSGYYQAVLSKV